MNIALCHYRVGETDGVSLEMDKWKDVLEKMGHKVYFLAGSTGSLEGDVIPELYYKNEVNEKIRKNAYIKLEDYEDEAELKDGIMKIAFSIEEKLEKFVKEKKIDALIPSNIMSSGWSLSAGIAFYGVAKKLGIRCIAHHHDFYWERDRYANPTCETVNKLLENYFPPEDDLIEHVVISKRAKKETFRRRKIETKVVPNVFDFKAPLWEVDEYNKGFRKSIGVGDDDILLLQATRVTERKAIELAIDVIGQMQTRGNLNELHRKKLYNGKAFGKDSRIAYVLAGLIEESPEYIEKLKKKAAAKNVNMIFINEVIKHSRHKLKKKKFYSLWDAYVHADFVTYPSIIEGWGNQLLETVFAKKPILIYEYPVYKSDLSYKCLNVVSLGGEHVVNEDGLIEVDREIVKNAAKQVIRMLVNSKERNIAVERNFEICSKFFSYENLHEILKELI